MGYFQSLFLLMSKHAKSYDFLENISDDLWKFILLNCVHRNKTHAHSFGFLFAFSWLILKFRIVFRPWFENHHKIYDRLGVEVILLSTCC